METWTCKDGTVVNIPEMGDTHLLNTIAMVKRGYDRAIQRAKVDYELFTVYDAEDVSAAIYMALYHNYEDLVNKGVSGFSKHYQPLVNEAKKRELL